MAVGADEEVASQETKDDQGEDLESKTCYHDIDTDVEKMLVIGDGRQSSTG